MIEILAALSVFVAVTSLVAAMSGLFQSPVEARLSKLTPTAPTRPLEARFGDRVMIPVLGGLTKGLMQLLPHKLVARTQRQMLAAGSPMTVQAFFTIVLLCAVGFPGTALFLVASAGGVSTLAAIALVFFAVGGVIVPFVLLRRRVRMRKLKVWRSLADAFDLITVCIEAGLGLDAALRQVSEKMRGPLSDEINIVLREVGIGRPRREALEDMAYRIDVPEVTTFVNAVVQAEQLGTSLGRVLRAQSITLRVKRRQRAEETARRAPVKMVFPLVLFIMPTFFIVTIGPIIIHAVNYLNE
jgi:tight adherence protein C